VDAVLARRCCVAAAVALLAGACGHGNDSTSPTTLATPGATTTVVAGATTTSGSSGGTVSRGKPPRGGATATTTAPSSARDDRAIADAAEGAAGRLAGILLASGPAKSLVIDVLVQPGVTPDADVLTTLRQILAATSGKPVELAGPRPLNSATTTYDADTIRRLADSQGRPQGDGAAVIYLLYLKGGFTDDSVLGVTVRADTTAIFPDQIASATSPIVSRHRLEQAVDTHELGHILGLVDLYLNDNRDDPEHPGHSTNPRSVMYWAVESDLVSQVLGGPPPVDFDGADQNDLRRIHAGAASA
jgi:hypothetical protein